MSEAYEDTSDVFTARGLSTQDVLALKPPLAARTNLTTIDLCNNNIWDRGVQAVADAMKSCGSLSTVLLSCNSIGTAGNRCYGMNWTHSLHGCMTAVLYSTQAW